MLRRMSSAWAKTASMPGAAGVLSPWHRSIVWYAKALPDTPEVFAGKDHPGIVWFRARGDNRKSMGLIR